MAGLGYPYDVIRGGDSQVFNPIEEARCPYAKVLIPTRAQFEPIAKRIFQEYMTDSTFSANVRVILQRTLVGHRTCSYHYSRALSTALVEAVGGHSGPEYNEFLPALTSMTRELAACSSASSEWVTNAYNWLDVFINAATAGGLRQFMRLYKESEKAP